MISTKTLPANDPESFAHAVRLLKAGKVIAIPTDTVYGVAAHGFDERAIEEIYRVKDRPRDKAIPYLLADAQDLEKVALVSPLVRELAEKLWPGALTLAVPALPSVPKILTAGGDSVAVRVPDHHVTRALIDSLGVPLAATSANISGGRDPATAEQVLDQLRGRIPLILDAGPTRGNVPSTVLDVTTDPPTIRRVGAISVEQIERVIGIKCRQE